MDFEDGADDRFIGAGASELTQPGELNAIPWEQLEELSERPGALCCVVCDIDLTDEDADFGCTVRADSLDRGERVSN